MTDSKDDDPNYKVGYGKPPLKGKFQKGVSGNPRGRRPKIEPSRTRLQHQMDFLSISEEPIIISINGKQRTISGFQAVIWKLQQKALSGDKHAIELYLRTKRELIDDFTEANPEATGMVENLHRSRITQPDELDAEAIKLLNEFHRKTRGK